jgi:hypothetical protein
MATTKLYDLAVKTGEYQSQGQTKGRYENIGAVMRGQDGGQFIMLKKTFNPAGVMGDRDTVLISCFEPRARDGNNNGGGGSGGYDGGSAGGGASDPAPSRDLGDTIPF